MRQEQATLPRNRFSDKTADVASICNELRTQLPGELIEINGARLRIEATVVKHDEGEALRHLCVLAFTPGHKAIVRYELNSQPSGPLAAKLAALILAAKEDNLPAERVMRSIRESLGTDGPYFFKEHRPPRNPQVHLPMEREIPAFDRFAGNPFSIDTSFKLDQQVNGSRVRAVATLHPERRYALIEAFSFPADGSATPEPTRFKVRCPPQFWSRSCPTPDVIAALQIATWSAMEALAHHGVSRQSVTRSFSEVDQRLHMGEIDTATSDPVLQLRSGARVLVEEGDTLACVRVESSATPNAGARFWRITSPDGLVLADNPRLIAAREAAKDLATGSPQKKRAALAMLGELERASHFQLPTEAQKKPPYETRPLDEFAGEAAAQVLLRYSSAFPKARTVLSVDVPNTDSHVLDLLDGIESVRLTFKDPGHNRRNPHDPEVLLLGFSSRGALKATAVSPLSNYIETFVPGRCFTGRRTIEATVRELASLFNEQTGRSLFKLRERLEELSRLSGGVPLLASTLRSKSSLYPPTYKPGLEASLRTAGEIAQVYETDMQEPISDVQVIFQEEPHCELVVRNGYEWPAVELRLHVSEFGVHAIDLNTMNEIPRDRYTFQLRTPLTMPEGRSILRELFTLLRSTSVSEEKSPGGHGTALTSTPLFKYLCECEERFDVV